MPKKPPPVSDTDGFLELARAVAAEKFGPERVPDVYHPVLNMAVAAQDPDLSTVQRASLDDKVASYLFAKKKAVEVKGDGYAQPTIQIVTYEQPKVVTHEPEGERPALPAASGAAADEGK